MMSWHTSVKTSVRPVSLCGIHHESRPRMPRMHILTEITCKWTDAVCLSCMFIACNHIPEKNTAYLCMSNPHTTSPEQIINSRTGVTGKLRGFREASAGETSDLGDPEPTHWHEQNCAEPDSVMTLSHPGQEGRSDGHLSFPVPVMGEPDIKKSNKKDLNTELGCNFIIPLACTRAVLLTALNVRAPSIEMNVMHLPENGQNGRILFLHECTPCQCLTTERERKKKSGGGNFVPSASTEWLGNKSKLTLTLSQRQGWLPLTRARRSVRPPEIKGRPARSLVIQALVWAVEVAAVVWKQPGSGSPPSTSGQHLQGAPLCTELPAALTVYSRRQRSHLGFFCLRKHNVILGIGLSFDTERHNQPLNKRAIECVHSVYGWDRSVH